jgi:hypothetical protein
MSHVQSSKLREWIQNTLSSKIIQAEREREKLLAEVSKALGALPEYCAQLSRKAEQNMETKRDNRAQYKAAKALNKLTALITGMCKSVNVPEEKDTQSLRNLQRELSKTASEAARVRTEYLRQIQPFHIIDMITLRGNIDKLHRLSEELHSFLMERGAILKSLEELDEKLKSLEKLQASRDNISQHKKTVELQLTEAQKLDTQLREQAQSVRHNKKMETYVNIDEKLRLLRTDLLRTGFSRLGRPLRKLVSISERGDYPLSVEVRETAHEYLRRPFATFLQETEGYPKLKTVMVSLSNAVSNGKLALKQREAKKVIDRSAQVVTEDSLSLIHRNARALKDMHDACLSDPETASLVQKLRELKRSGRANHLHEKELDFELQNIVEMERKANDQIASSIREIESFSNKLTGTNIQIRS